MIKQILNKLNNIRPEDKQMIACFILIIACLGMIAIGVYQMTITAKKINAKIEPKIREVLNTYSNARIIKEDNNIIVIEYFNDSSPPEGH